MFLPPSRSDASVEDRAAKPAPADRIRTDTSDFPGKPSTAETAKLIAGLLGLAVAGLALVVQFRGRRQLRKPTDKQIDNMAKPLARIGLRHVETGVINADLLDMIAAGTALADYVTDGPLTYPGPEIDPGIPADLQEVPQ